MRDTVDMDTIEDRAIALWELSTAQEKTAGASWYDSAHRFARDLSKSTGVKVGRIADIIAITSPNQTWKGNMTLTNRHVRDGWIGGLPSVRAGLISGQPKGRKVQQFARAIAGDTRAVVVDRWMARAFGIPTGRKSYPAIEQGITTAADKLGISPRALQATIWCHIRGKVD